MKNQLDANKSVFHDFIEFVFNQKRPEGAIAKSVESTYKQHNPIEGDGSEPFIAYIHQLADVYPSIRYNNRRR